MKIRSLDAAFRDALIDDCIAGNITTIDIWRLVPVVHIGRLQMITLIRKFVLHMNRLYPGSMRSDANKLRIDPVFLSFMSTHRQIRSSEKDSRQAWAAIRSIESDAPHPYR